MKRMLSMTILLAALLLAAAPPGAEGQQGAGTEERWDLTMIREAPQWQPLLTAYPYADHRRFWPERKAALESILERHPDSRWADDAALCLACGRASFDGDLAGAAAEMERIAAACPEAQTVVDRWDPEADCRFDETWLMWQGSLVFLDPDGSPRSVKPFDRDRVIDSLEQESLTYFGHLERYPRSTATVARWLGARMLLAAGERDRATDRLDGLAAAASRYLPRILAADRLAAAGPDGFLILRQPPRPEVEAVLALAAERQRQGRTEDALAAAGILAGVAAQDLPWSVHRRLGDLYRQAARADLAETRYDLALEGLESFRQADEARIQRVGGSEIPPGFWTDSRGRLEQRQQELKTPAGQTR